MARLMSLTNALLVVILLILLKQFYPTLASLVTPAVLGIGALYLGHWLFVRFPAQWKARRTVRKQEELDEKEYWEYKAQHSAIRVKYGPDGKWHEAIALPAAYVSEMRDLNLRHGEMLRRRNGWTDEDFSEVMGDA